MPTIHEFFGILIIIHAGREHPPPHIHIKYQEHEAIVNIETGEMTVGTLPPRALKLVRKWLNVNRAAVMEQWKRMERGERVEKIR